VTPVTIPNALQALDRLPLAVAIRESAWLFPALEIVHLAGIAALFGALLLVDLRVFGLRRSLPLPELGRFGAAVAASAFVVIVASGGLLALSNAAGYIANRAFVAKLGFITLAALNMIVFHLRDGLARADAIARVQAAVSLALWLAAIAAGRLIAYL
jgi:hypothetical protein